MKTTRSNVSIMLILAMGFGGVVGCDSSQNQPNPDLKAPDVPPGGRGTKDKGILDPTKKQKS